MFPDGGLELFFQCLVCLGYLLFQVSKVVFEFLSLSFAINSTMGTTELSGIKCTYGIYTRVDFTYSRINFVFEINLDALIDSVP